MCVCASCWVRVCAECAARWGAGWCACSGADKSRRCPLPFLLFCTSLHPSGIDLGREAPGPPPSGLLSGLHAAPTRWPPTRALRSRFPPPPSLVPPLARTARVTCTSGTPACTAHPIDGWIGLIGRVAGSLDPAAQRPTLIRRLGEQAWPPLEDGALSASTASSPTPTRSRKTPLAKRI